MKLQINNSKISIEMMILTLIIAILVIVSILVYINGQKSARDRIRLVDIEQIQDGLRLYFNENGSYPQASNGVPKAIEDYLSFWPSAPKADGDCSDTQNVYYYSQKGGGEDYTITFCLGQKYENLAAGTHTATGKGIE